MAIISVSTLPTNIETSRSVVMMCDNGTFANFTCDSDENSDISVISSTLETAKAELTDFLMVGYAADSFSTDISDMADDVVINDIPVSLVYAPDIAERLRDLAYVDPEGEQTIDEDTDPDIANPFHEISAMLLVVVETLRDNFIGAITMTPDDPNVPDHIYEESQRIYSEQKEMIDSFISTASNVLSVAGMNKTLN